MRATIQRITGSATTLGIGLLAGVALAGTSPEPVSSGTCRAAIAWADQLISDYAEAYESVDNGSADGTDRWDHQQAFHTNGRAYVVRRDACLAP